MKIFPLNFMLEQRAEEKSSADIPDSGRRIRCGVSEWMAGRSDVVRGWGLGEIAEKIKEKFLRRCIFN